MADCRWLSLTFTFLVLLYPTNAKCTGRYGEIQNYLTSSDPLFDNYLNISRAVYPSVDLPSLRILITVKFLSTPCGANASSACLTTNETTIYKYTWSTSCLYVSPQPIELFSMRLFSLWTIWPSRRTSRLHITLPQSCRPPAEDDSTLIYFLSTLQDVAVNPDISDPRLNTAECLTAGHGKAPGGTFSGVKKCILHHACWFILGISLVSSTIASQWLILKMKDWHKGRIAGTVLMSIFVLIAGLALICHVLHVSSGNDTYAWVILASLIFILFRRVVYCCVIRKGEENFRRDLTSGHDEITSTNIFSCTTLYPAVFIVCHHLLWIMLGVITEPFWAFTILVAAVSVFGVFFFLVEELYLVWENCPGARDCPDRQALFESCMATLLILGAALSLFGLIFVVFTVAQPFLSEDVIYNIVKSGLTVAGPVIIGFLVHETRKGPASEVTHTGQRGGGQREEQQPLELHER